MMMERETSHHRACSSHGIPGQMFKKHANYSPANLSSSPPSNIQRNLSELSLSDLLVLAKQLKYPGITTLRLPVSPKEQLIVSQRFGDADQRTTHTLSAFTRALAHSIEGWLQNLELGVCFGLRDINTLCPAIRYSKTLRHLSFANSGLGDVTLQVLSSGLQNCLPLRTLNLSGCALTDASASVVTTIVKGDDPNARPLPQKFKENSPAEHRAPKYGQQWRQNVILIGKWSPAPAVGTINIRDPQQAKLPIGGLVALDLSCNSFTDALAQELCPILYKRPPLRALNLRCNRMTRLGAKPLLDVMKEFNVLRLVDMRGNSDESLLGVLENGEHYTTFSTFQAPFWMDPESLDPIICNPTKPRSNTPAKRSKFTSSLSRSSMPEKQNRVILASQHVVKVKGGGGSRNNSPSRINNTSSKVNNTSASRVNPSPSCSGASVSRPAAEWGCKSQKRYHFSNQESPYVHVYRENEEMPDFIDHNVNRRFISAPRKERPAKSSARSPQRSAWPEKTTFFDRSSHRPTSSAHISSSHDQEDDGRFISPTGLELPREHPMQRPNVWDTSTPHELDTRDMHISKGIEGSRRYSNEAKRAQSAGYIIHWPGGYPRDYKNLDFYRESRHQNCYRNFSALRSPSRRYAPSTNYNGEAESQGKKSPEKSPIRCHYRCKVLNDVPEHKRNMSKIAKAVQVKHAQIPHLNQLLPKAPPLPEDKKELVEWNDFVNQLTQTLMNLKDGFDQLIGPTEGTLALVAQHAVTKLHQMPSSFFRSGMLRQLDRSCRVLNSQVATLATRHKESMRDTNAENQAPIPCGEATKKESSKDISANREVLGKQDKQDKLDKNPKTFRTLKQLGVQNNNPNVKQRAVHSCNQNAKQIGTQNINQNVNQICVQNINHQHPVRLIHQTILPPLAVSKGTNIP